ncbi:auxin efflux carrier family protein [Haloterrigena salina JCM 13891]|uniref:Auxin efflux carrier family protein n=1 Tax=Haloterrigena salina JCM 13891 TaxID=1227488 RepID=M0C3H2_9EURY|nr:AEC family transporter [Haloterrigena salina]ELZ17213.1 auxin efflux carrier family protein [Haloterrigena salina JCM 13891]
MELFVRLSGLLVVLLLGTGLRTTGLLDARRTTRLNAVAYYVALPALIFVSTYDRAIGELLSLTLLGGLLFVLFATVGLAWLVHCNHGSIGRRSVAVVQSYHSNLGYLGLPLVAATFDAEVTATASVVLGVVTLTQLPLSVLLLSMLNGADAAIGDELLGLAKNPVLGSLIAGLAVGSLGITLPGPAATGLDLLGSVALPLALLCVGASLEVDLPSIDLGATGAVIGLKIVCMPALAWAVFSVLAVDAATFTAAVVMLGTPTAVSTFVFAAELGGDEEFASLNVFATTLVSMLTLFVLITLVS